MAQYIYTMNRVAKVVPPKRQIIHDISLSFFPGAKIGVLGLNGSGKSTLLHVIAGDETPDEGRVLCPRGIRIGMLRQEIDPRLEHSVQEEAARALAKLDELEREMRGLEHEMSHSGNTENRCVELAKKQLLE